MNQLLSTARPASVADLYAPILADLQEVERVLAESMQSRRPFVAELVAHLDNYRGKRLRPALLLLAAGTCGRVGPEHHVLGAVIEMVHTATLVHDDVLDGASLRRHVATVNARWGTQNSILLGDFLFSRAFHLSSTLGDARACRLIGEATNRVCEGELQQGAEQGNLALTEAEYLDIIDGKTAELTACACRLGAIYSGASDDRVEDLAAYGRLLGLAFQIADDLLDLTGEEGKAGKSLGTDLELQKMTLPVIRLLAQASPTEADRLRELLRQPNPETPQQLRGLLRTSGALEYATQRARAFAAEARDRLTDFPESASRRVLQILSERVVDRDR